MVQHVSWRCVYISPRAEHGQLQYDADKLAEALQGLIPSAASARITDIQVHPIPKEAGSLVWIIVTWEDDQ